MELPLDILVHLKLYFNFSGHFVFEDLHGFKLQHMGKE